jgi:hypothetical protein
MHNQTSRSGHADPASAYRRLLIMSALSFVSMYVLMYAMVDVLGNVLANVNQLYMAGIMTAPMVLIELVLMRSMYPSARANQVIAGVTIVAFCALFLMIRRQTFVTDEQFLRSMIPHHGGAILMCEQAPLADPGIQELCGRILSSQRAEISEMQAKLTQLEH